MAGRVAGRGDEGHAAVAEHVMVAFKFGRWMLRLEAADAEGVRPFVLDLLYQQHRLRKQFNVTDVVGVSVGNRYVFEVGRFDAECVELAGERLRALPMCHSWIGRPLPFRHGSDRVGYSGIPE